MGRRKKGSGCSTGVEVESTARGLVGEDERVATLSLCEAPTDARVRVLFTFVGLVRGDGEGEPVLMKLWPTDTTMGVDCFTLVSSIFMSNLVHGCH